MRTVILFLAVTLTVAFNGNLLAQHKQEMKKSHMNMAEKSMRSPAFDLKTNMRQLWEEHVIWTRNVIMCLVDNTPGKNQAVKRLLKNQDDIGNAIKPYYGEAAGKKLTDLLYPHIKIAAEVVNAAKAGNSVALDKANKRWYANADEIAEFLSKANPNWKLKDMKEMMHDHLKLTTEEALKRIKKDYDGDVKAFDLVHFEILKMSDMLAEGIVMQFPAKFKMEAKK
ncbi:hypothetical protein ACMDB5_11565 [Flavobacterium sp. W1B]|uniref:hypothetical protein n=1 Tax=Flavobacterium sp. W1B TaxID=3394146 RepID=UPI0039BCE3BD